MGVEEGLGLELGLGLGLGSTFCAIAAVPFVGWVWEWNGCVP